MLPGYGKGDEVRKLSAQPLPASEVARSVYLYSEDMALGTQQEPKKIVEAVIRIGKHHVVKLPVSPDAGIDAGAWSLYKVELPFTLEKPPGERECKWFKFEIKLADDKVTAYDLFPRTTVEPRKDTLKFGLTPKLKFAWADVGAEISYQSEFEVLRPKITVYDVGRHAFRWEYEGEPVLPGTKYALMVLEVPSGMTQVTGQVQIEGLVSKGAIPLLREVRTFSDVIPIEWDLR